MLAHYEGEPQVVLLPGGRDVKLLAGFAFVDAENTRWAVPTGAVVDGASIPRLLWPIIGGPFEGNYRDASIIHDWFCDIRTRKWRATHRMFYDAMLVSGVRPPKAKIMYFAVRWRGPRWEERVVLNTTLPVDHSFDFIPSGTTLETVTSPGERLSNDRQLTVMENVKTMMESGDYSLDQIDSLAEKDWTDGVLLSCGLS